MNKMLCLLILLVFIQQISTYSRDGGVQYARDHCHNINHQCGYYTDCTPCSYWGSEHCGYGGNGGPLKNLGLYGPYKLLNGKLKLGFIKELYK